MRGEVLGQKNFEDTELNQVKAFFTQISHSLICCCDFGTLKRVMNKQFSPNLFDQESLIKKYFYGVNVSLEHTLRYAASWKPTKDPEEILLIEIHCVRHKTSAPKELKV